MITVTLELPDEVADAFVRLPEKDISEVKSFIELLITPPKNTVELENALRNIASEVRMNGMTEDEIDVFLDNLS